MEATETNLLVMLTDKTAYRILATASERRISHVLLMQEVLGGKIPEQLLRPVDIKARSLDLRTIPLPEQTRQRINQIARDMAITSSEVILRILENTFCEKDS